MNEPYIQNNMPQDQEYKPIRESTIYTHTNLITKYVTQEKITGITNNIQITNNIKIIDNNNETLALDDQHHSITNNKSKKEKNPYDRNGIQLSCDICESIYHMAQNCSKSEIFIIYRK